MAMTEKEKLERIFRSRGYRDFKWADPPAFVAAGWLRMKYLFG